VKNQVREKIERSRYFTLNAARQTGKITLVHEVVADLEETGNYFGILLNFESLCGHRQAEFYDQLGGMLIKRNLPALQKMVSDTKLPSPAGLRDQSDFINWLSEISAIINRRGLLIIDEFDAIGAELAEPMLGAFRYMYLNRHDPVEHAFSSTNGDVPVNQSMNGSFRHRYLVDDVLNMDGLMDSFKKI